MPMYKLQGVVEHEGSWLEAGHFVSYVKRGNQWYLINDTHVQQISFDQVCIKIAELARVSAHE